MYNTLLIVLIPLLLLLIFAVIPVLLGVYVYRDAKSRGMDAVLWTIIAVLVPSLIGFIVYLVVRGNHAFLQCPQCSAPVNEAYAVCPRCGAPLKGRCPRCGYAVEPDWRVCAHCAAPLEGVTHPAPPVRRKDKTLKYVLIFAVALPLLLCLAMVIGLAAYTMSAPSGGMSMSATDQIDKLDLQGNPAVTDWLAACDAKEDGLYALHYDTREGEGRRGGYLLYLTGVRTAVTGQAETQWRQKQVLVRFSGSDFVGEKDYALFAVDYSAPYELALAVEIDGRAATVEVETIEGDVWLQDYPLLDE